VKKSVFSLIIIRSTVVFRFDNTNEMLDAVDNINKYVQVFVEPVDFRG